jgi:hypothetical protein
MAEGMRPSFFLPQAISTHGSQTLRVGVLRSTAPEVATRQTRRPSGACYRGDGKGAFPSPGRALPSSLAAPDLNGTCAAFAFP